MSAVIILGLVCFVAGAIIGWAAYKTAFPFGESAIGQEASAWRNRSRRAELRLRAIEKALEDV